MSTVVLHAVVSLDGFVAGPDDDPGPLFDWYFNGDLPLAPQDMDDPAPGGLRVSAASHAYVRDAWDGVGCMVIGRRLFDLTDGWQGRPPAGEHVVVVSHRPRPDGWHPEASYTFVDDVAEAVATARTLAGERTVSVAAGDVGGQCLALGLVDEVATDLAPVVLGDGRRFFGHDTGRHLLEDPHVVIQGDRVLHLRFRVRS
ncbi:dihydrofolate reductase family protein [Nocardioides zeicaulis]|uniref:Dihydrofolate reductase family protein n=1 Tax=Nocardioides zeicaulis TaxID=1776857 RepID=A0ABV6E3Z2_9ACTN